MLHQQDCDGIPRNFGQLFDRWAVFCHRDEKQLPATIVDVAVSSFIGMTNLLLRNGCS
jgi:hypothetical protein